MKLTKIYQTLEDRGNDNEILNHGPYFCSYYDNGQLKEGVREPWLGEGYYFWDTRIEDAKWWGETIYSKSRGYVVCETEYDQHSELLFDLLGDIEALRDFVECANCMIEEKGTENISFTKVLNYMRKYTDFSYKAIRALPFRENTLSSNIVFPNNKYTLRIAEKVQICFLDKTLLVYPFTIVYKK